jgi:hypothetical protein
MRMPLALAASITLLGAGAQSQIPKPAPFPLQMEMRVPFDPTVFPSEGRSILLYELHLTNFTPSPLSLERVEVIDPDSPAPAITVFDGERLQTMITLLTSGSPTTPPQVAGGQTIIVFMSVSFENGARIPDRLIHRIVASGGIAEGAVIGTRHTRLQVLGSPLKAQIGLQTMVPATNPTIITVTGSTSSMASR